MFNELLQRRGKEKIGEKINKRSEEKKRVVWVRGGVRDGTSLGSIFKAQIALED